VRTAYMAGNWKMHKTPSESAAFARELKRALSHVGHKLMVAPAFPCISAVVDVLKGTNVLVGAQNMSSEEQGAHTGEVSVLMLKDLGVRVVILGHSERRHTYGETDKFINAKVQLALKHGMEIILCVGETLEEREAGKVDDVVNGQLAGGLHGVSESQLPGITIAYEPVWAIGTGRNATPEDADAVHRTIRNTISAMYSKAAAEAMVIQYGGSVKPDNVKSLMSMANIDGALVGGAALKIDSFEPIAKFDQM